MPKTQNKSRYHEIDALRSIALVLLIFYHVLIYYQPFAAQHRFIPHEELLPQYWIVGDLLNIWRVPIIFVMSGLALGFMHINRSTRAILAGRLARLLPPLVFSSVFIAPTFPMLFDMNLGQTPRYRPAAIHLWFVAYLIAYTVLLSPFIELGKRRPKKLAHTVVQKAMPWGLPLLLAVPLAIETSLTKPTAFAYYPDRFWFGFICFGGGFLFASAGRAFWRSVRKTRLVMLVLAITLFIVRIASQDNGLPEFATISTPLEASFWMFAFLGYGSWLFHAPAQIWDYLNKAVFPVYIIHFPLMQLVAFFLFQWQIPAELAFVFHIFATFGISFAAYHYLIRPMTFLHPVLGLKQYGKTRSV